MSLEQQCAASMVENVLDVALTSRLPGASTIEEQHQPSVQTDEVQNASTIEEQHQSCVPNVSDEEQNENELVMAKERRDDIPTKGLANSSGTLSGIRIGAYQANPGMKITVCGMQFDINRKTIEKEEFRCILPPTIPYRHVEKDVVLENVIYEQGYDQSQPLITAEDDKGQIFIVDGNSRRQQIEHSLSEGKLEINSSVLRSEMKELIRKEPPIPVIHLYGRHTTAVERLALSMSLNTAATERLKPLQLADVVLSLNAFTRSKFTTDGDKPISDLVDDITNITSAAMRLQLLHHFIDCNTAHRDLMKRWTLQNTSDSISTEEQVSSMNMFEAYKIYILCSLSFWNCPETFSFAFGENGKRICHSNFECQWNPALYSEEKFILLHDQNKVFIMLTLLIRQRTWGTKQIPYTSLPEAINIIDLHKDILSTGINSINKKLIRKGKLNDAPIHNALIADHPDKSVREQPYITSILFFLVQWKSNSRKYSRRSILREVKNDLSGWPKKRSWQKMEVKQYSVTDNLFELIGRKIHTNKCIRTGRPTKRSRDDNNDELRRNKRRLLANEKVVSSLDNDSNFLKLMTLGTELGANRAVKAFTKNQWNGSSVNLHDSALSPDEYSSSTTKNEPHTNDDQPMVPLSKVIKWFGKHKVYKKNYGKHVGSMLRSRTRKRIVSDSSEDESMNYSKANAELAIVRQSFLNESETKSLTGKVELIYEPLNNNLPGVFTDDSIWSYGIEQSKIQKIFLQYRNAVIREMKEDGLRDVDERYKDCEIEKNYYEDILITCYKKLSHQKLQSDGYLYLPKLFDDESRDSIDCYLDFFKEDFEKTENQMYWSEVLSRSKDQKLGRYQVFYDEDNFSDLLENKSVFESKCEIEIKMGIALHNLTRLFKLKVDPLGSYPIAYTGECVRTTPMYNHEVGRYRDSPRRHGTEFVPFQMFATGKDTFVIRLYENSHYHSHRPWENRKDHAERFRETTFVMEPYSFLAIRGDLLYELVESETASEHGPIPTFAIRWFAYQEDYDDEDDVSADFNSHESEIGESNCESIIDSQELDDLREEIGDELFANENKGLVYGLSSQKTRGSSYEKCSDVESEDLSSKSSESSTSESDSPCALSDPKRRCSGNSKRENVKVTKGMKVPRKANGNKYIKKLQTASERGTDSSSADDSDLQEKKNSPCSKEPPQKKGRKGPACLRPTPEGVEQRRRKADLLNKKYERNTGAKE